MLQDTYRRRHCSSSGCITLLNIILLIFRPLPIMNSRTPSKTLILVITSPTASPAKAMLWKANTPCCNLMALFEKLNTLLTIIMGKDFHLSLIIIIFPFILLYHMLILFIRIYQKFRVQTSHKHDEVKLG